jgi:NADPH:quinone reductase-like Zn-dependent oxidoreductase
MRAIVQDRYGGPEVLRLVTDLPIPEPGPGEVQVRVHAASVNAADWHSMRGMPRAARLMAPKVFGRTGPLRRERGQDFAGTVTTVGPGVGGFSLGEDVYGEIGLTAPHGAFAEYTTVPVAQVAPKPAGLSYEEAAAIPLAGDTALQGVKDVGHIHAGQSVLIIGASGGVGTFAAQLAKAYGATVTAVASASAFELLRSLGADELIDYHAHDFASLGRRWDVVLDLSGCYSLGHLRRALAPDGTLVLSGGGNPHDEGFLGPMSVNLEAMLVDRFTKQHLVTLQERPDRAHLDELRELAEAGVLWPVIEHRYRLEDTAEALRHHEDDPAHGKIVITV